MTRAILLDLSQQIKAATRIREGLAEPLMEKCSLLFDEIAIAFLPHQATELANVLGRVSPTIIESDSDALLEEYYLPHRLRQMRSVHSDTWLFTTREGVRSLPWSSLHLFVHEDPRERKKQETLNRQSVRAQFLHARTQLRFQTNVKRAVAITTPSNWTVETLRNNYPTSPALERARVAYEGAFDRDESIAPREERSYVLLSSSRDQRDRTGWAEDVLRSAMTVLPIMPEIRVFGKGDSTTMTIAHKACGFVDDESLRTLYRGALVYIHPTNFEGFGLPLAEAMQAGTPVIAPCGSAVTEVAGEGAFKTIDSAAKYLSELITNAEQWKAASAAALKRAKVYRWDRCAGIIVEQMTNVLEE